METEKVCVLLYADDLVLLAESESDLQKLLDALNIWCLKWRITVNSDKSQVVHFRTPSIPQSSFSFTCGSCQIKTVDRYKYLGLIIHQFLDFKITADAVAKSASRALGLLIAKAKAFGGVSHSCFTKLYDSMVGSIIGYGAGIWGQREYSSINAVHNRACRYFLGVGRYTPNVAVQGEMAWKTPWQLQWMARTRLWCRFVNMSQNRVNKQIFLWTHSRAIQNRCKNWCF
jgi:hypothetical protein